MAFAKQSNLPGQNVRQAKPSRLGVFMSLIKTILFEGGAGGGGGESGKRNRGLPLAAGLRPKPPPRGWSQLDLGAEGVVLGLLCNRAPRMLNSCFVVVA